MASKRAPGVLGLLRETKSMWERRAALAPVHVSRLVRQGIEVVVQPSNHRIFTNGEYEQAGATVTEDMSRASVLLGVKEVDANLLIPDKSYVFFGHTIKAQPYNMPLLDTVLAKNVRYFDYECIKQPGQQGQRLVAFGRFAGVAGMIDFTRGMGERLLTLGYMTPFLNMPSAYMCRNLDEARIQMRSIGEDIQRKGLPDAIGPFTVVFTGSGKVSQGAQEMFELLPHELVSCDELKDLVESGKWSNRVLYKAVATTKDIVERNDGGAYNSVEYYSKPELYKPVFHEKIAPYASTIVNCVYWDERYHRLITRAQQQALVNQKKNRMFALCDISCDVAGSIEWMDNLTSIQKPYYVYDPIANENTEDLSAEGIFVHSVDHLPAELPVDATMHFGDALLPFVPALVASDPTLPLEQQGLPAELEAACITNHGKLTPNFEYITSLRKAKRAETNDDVAPASVVKAFRLRGHLFDSGLVNALLDLVEASPCSVDILDISPGGNTDVMTSMVVMFQGAQEGQVDDVVKKAQTLLEISPRAGASLKSVAGSDLKRFLRSSEGSDKISQFRNTHVDGEEAAPAAHVSNKSPKKVLVLGSGFVAGPTIAYLLRDPANTVTVCSNASHELDRIRGMEGNLILRGLDLSPSNQSELDALVAESDLVVSLLPAPFHPVVAGAAIRSKTNMVTASYVSPEIAAMDQQAKDAGIVIVNEVGLDPGMDHMSALEIIRNVQAKGGKITRFISTCGGLPAPEAADNPLGYKFSWSPRGVLRASGNPSRFLRDGQIVEQPGSDLLKYPQPIVVNPAYSLEMLYNRDSIPYIEHYGIQGVSNMYRGTLRYKGFSEIMYGLRSIGLFDESDNATLAANANPVAWKQVIDSLVPGGGSLEDRIGNKMVECGSTNDAAANAISCLQWLGMLGENVAPREGTVIDSFCALLADTLTYKEYERDMCLMHHEFDVTYKDNHQETITSTLVEYGNVQTGVTSMAKTVGEPTAMIAQLILDGDVELVGVQTGMNPVVYQPVLKLLEQEGIHFHETVVAK